MRLFWWGVVLALALLAALLKAPVWYIIARVSEVAGGTGWYRSCLIEQAIKHLDEWWLVGSTSRAHWAPAGEVVPADHNNTDSINHYVADGLGGGVFKLVLFVAVIVASLKITGRRARQPTKTLPKPLGIFTWSFGVSLFAHCTLLLSVAATRGRGPSDWTPILPRSRPSASNTLWSMKWCIYLSDRTALVLLL